MGGLCSSHQQRSEKALSPDFDPPLSETLTEAPEISARPNITEQEPSNFSTNLRLNSQPSKSLVISPAAIGIEEAVFEELKFEAKRLGKVTYDIEAYHKLKDEGKVTELQLLEILNIFQEHLYEKKHPDKALFFRNFSALSMESFNLTDCESVNTPDSSRTMVTLPGYTSLASDRNGDSTHESRSPEKMARFSSMLPPVMEYDQSRNLSSKLPDQRLPKLLKDRSSRISYEVFMDITRNYTRTSTAFSKSTSGSLANTPKESILDNSSSERV